MQNFHFVASVRKISNPFVEKLSQRQIIDVEPISLEFQNRNEVYQIIVNDTKIDFEIGDKVLFYCKLVKIYKSIGYEIQCINFETL